MESFINLKCRKKSQCIETNFLSNCIVRETKNRKPVVARLLYFRTLPCIILLILLSNTLCSVTHASETINKFDTTNTNELFDRGSTVLFPHVGYIYGIGNGDRSVEAYNFRIEMGYYIRENIAVYIDMQIVVFKGSVDTQRAYAIGFGQGGSLRWHFINRGAWSMYFDHGIGLIFTDKRFPPQGTSSNGTPYYGLGLTFRINKKTHVVISGRQFHLSNGRGIVPDNPAYDGIGTYVGMILRM